MSKALKVFTYRNSGVNYQLMDAFKNACLKANQNPPQIIEFPHFYLTDILEGLGSLNKLAEDIYEKTGQNFFYQVGWGNAASIFNDLSSMGARPLSIKLFVATGGENWFKDRALWKQLIKGFKDAARFAGASWNGGETQTLVDIVGPKSVVLAGSAVGLIQPKSKLLIDQKLQSGDRIILLCSSGVHTNGITLIRRLFKDVKTYIQAIKNKTVIYSQLINQLLDTNIEIHYGSHITGHGWRKIMRPKKEFTYIIEQIPKPQPIFRQIQLATSMSSKQMYQDYNMGAGFALFAPPESVNKVINLASKLSIPALNAGYIQTGPRKVIIEPINAVFEGETLNIR